LTTRNIKLFFSLTRGATEKVKNLRQPLFMPRSTHVCQQKSNPSRDPVPLRKEVKGRRKRGKREKRPVHDLSVVGIGEVSIPQQYVEPEL
jgi:hypothetical protein